MQYVFNVTNQKLKTTYQARHKDSVSIDGLLFAVNLDGVLCSA